MLARPLRGMAGAFTNLIMDFYKADDIMLEDLQAWVERYIPENNLKAKVQRLKVLWDRQSDLRARLSNQELCDLVSKPLDRTGRKVLGRYLVKLEDDMQTYCDLTWDKGYFRHFMHRADVRQCMNSHVAGYLLWIEIRTEAYLTLATLLVGILVRVEQIFGQSLASRLGEFVAFRAARYECYDEQTRILTRHNGFRFFRELTDEDEVATLNVQTGGLEWQKPLSLHRYEYHGELLHFKHPFANLMVTPNHRMYVKKRKEWRDIPGSGFEIIEAEELYSWLRESSHNSCVVKKDCEWTEKEVDEFVIPSDDDEQARKERYTIAMEAHAAGYGSYQVEQLVGVPDSTVSSWINGVTPHTSRVVRMVDWLRFFGWYLAEGNTNIRKKTVDGKGKHQYQINFSVNHKEKGLVQQIIAGIGLSSSTYDGPRSNASSVRCSNRDLACYLRRFGRCYEKYVPDNLKELDPKQLQILLRSLIEGDGCKPHDRSGYVYVTVSKRLAEDVAEIALKCGYATSLIRQKMRLKPLVYFNRASQKFGILRERHQSLHVAIHERRSAVLKRHNVKRVTYDGDVYSVTVPNGLILVERAGQIVWSGNSGVLDGDTSKWLEERTALMYVVAYAISRPTGVSKSLDNIIKAAVRVSGLRFATSYQPELGPLEVQAAEDWFKLHVPENVKKRFEWIDVASREGGPRKQPVFELHLGYAKKLQPQEFYLKRFPTPFFYVPKQFWKQSILEDETFPSDILSGTIPLVAVPPKGLFLIGKRKQIPIVGIWAIKGGGKTVLQYATACWRIDRGYVVFQPTMPRDQALVVCLPMFSTKEDLENLRRQRIVPRGMPARFLTIYEKDSDVRKSAPYTIYDRKICVDDLGKFELNWKKLLSDFKRGYLTARDLSAEQRTSLMRSSLVTDFMNYRKIDRSRHICLTIDEIQDMYGAIFRSSEEAALVRTMQSSFNDVRGLDLPTEFASSRPSLLQPDVLETVTSFVFGEVRESGREKVRSSRAVMFEAIRSQLPDEEKKFIPLVQKIMENVELSKLKLFFMVDHRKRIRLIRALLPPHMLEDPQIDSRTQLENYEKANPGKQLLVSWNEVPDLEVTSSSSEHKGIDIEYR